MIIHFHKKGCDKSCSCIQLRKIVFEKDFMYKNGLPEATGWDIAGKKKGYFSTIKA
jgi:hypothetical protein